MFRIISITMLMLISSAAFASPNVFQDGLKFYLKGDIENAVQIWRQLANEGDVKAQKQMGQYYLTDHHHRDYEQAIDWYQRASSQGDLMASKQLNNAKETYATWQVLASEIGSEAAYSTMTFREHLLEGDDTHCGLVVEVKSKVVLIQTDKQPRWFKKDDLYSPDIKSCIIDA